MKVQSPEQSLQFLQGGGEMGLLTRSYDWSQTSIGKPEEWPQSLRTSLSIILHSKFPMFLFWGKELTCFYNDAFRPSLGNEGKHPFALGKPGIEVWPEIWSYIKPLIDQVLVKGEATWNEDQLVPFYRNGRIENIYWTFSYSPVCDESGQPAGVFVTCMETTAKIETIRQLEENKDQLEFAIEATELGTFDYNPLTNKFSSNNRLKEWFGLPSQSEIELSDATDSIAEKDRQRVIEAIQQALSYGSGGHYDIEYSIVHPHTKKETVVRAKGRAWFNKECIAERFNGTLQDVTQQSLNRKKTEESEQRIFTLVKNAPFPIGVYVGQEMRIELANESIRNIWGKGHDVIGKLYKEILPELENQKVFEQLYDVFTTGISFHAQNQYLDLFVDGKLQPYYFNYSFTPLYDTEGKVYAVMNTAADVTDLNVAKQKIEESIDQLSKTTKRLQLALEAGQLGSYELELSTGLVECTAQCKKNFGLGLDSSLSYGALVAMVHSEDQPNMQSSLQKAIENNSLYDAKYRITWPDGSLHWIHAAGIPFYAEDGTPRQIIGVTREITEQKLFEQELAKQVQDRTKELAKKNMELEKMNSELQSFAYISSHDLQEPLRKIQTYAYHIMEKESSNLSADGRKYFDRMQSAADRMRTLIQDLLAYSRINNNDQVFELTDINQLATEVLEDFKDVIQEKQATIKAHALCTTHVVSFQFRQLLQNLIGNALKFASPERKPVIEITSEFAEGRILGHAELSDKQRYCHIMVSDNGIGFESAYKEKIFEVFQRLHSNSQYQGTGIGLAIVKKIVENHHGIIAVESELDKGSTFHIYIPA